MPVRPEFRMLYPPGWAALSLRVRLGRAGGRCQGCARPRLAEVRCLPDGRWLGEGARTWRDRRGRPARWPGLAEAAHMRLTRVVLAAAHLDGNPANNRLANLRGLCQRCHMPRDRAFHRAQRWLAWRRRWAVGDLFLGRYGGLAPAAALLAAASLEGRPSGSGRAGPYVLRTAIASPADIGWPLPRARTGHAHAFGPASDLFKPAR